MDRYDVAILVELQLNGRLSNRELAKRIGLSPTPCWRRVRDLETAGVIRGYAALLDPEALGIHVTALANVILENHHPDTVAEFDSTIATIPEVLECHMLSGDYDYALKVVARDMAHYAQLLREQLLSLKAVHRVSSNFVMASTKIITAYPVYFGGD
jgi:DNA-binding Lrp family transcriptional regulator